MTPTKKQITEVTEAARNLNVQADIAIRHLNSCSLSVYKAIGATGVVEAALESIERSKDTIRLSDCAIERITDEAICVTYIGLTLTPVTFWVPKSKITNETFPKYIAVNFLRN